MRDHGFQPDEAALRLAFGMKRGLFSARFIYQSLDADQGKLIGNVNADPTVMRDLLIELFALTAHGSPA
jgi:hypothetical protein